MNEFSYEWLRVLKHKCDKRVILKNGIDDFNDITNDCNLKVDYLGLQFKLNNQICILVSKAVIFFNKYENFRVNQMTSNIYYDFEYLGKLNFKSKV